MPRKPRREDSAPPAATPRMLGYRHTAAGFYASGQRRVGDELTRSLRPPMRERVRAMSRS